MNDVRIVGVGMTPFGKHRARSIRSLATEAAREALSDAGVEPGDLGMVLFANSFSGLLDGQESIRGQVALGELALPGTPLVNVENACASGASAVYLARQAVAAGECDLALAVGAEKLYVEDRRAPMTAMLTAMDVQGHDAIRKELGVDAGELDRSIFMDLYASMSREFMVRTGATERDFAQVAVKSHQHAAGNPNAQYRDQVSLEQVLDSRCIVAPLRLLMCSPIGDGAAAVLVASASRASQLGAASVRIRSSALASGYQSPDDKAVVAAARRAYESAGIGPEDLDVVELHDAAAPSELMLYEELGLTAQGGAADLLWSGATTLGGRLPVNPSGGLISKGHPVGATGCAQIVELTQQLRGRCGPRQVEGARTALAQNAGGYLSRDVAAAAVTILSC